LSTTEVIILELKHPLQDTFTRHLTTAFKPANKLGSYSLFAQVKNV